MRYTVSQFEVLRRLHIGLSPFYTAKICSDQSTVYELLQNSWGGYHPCHIFHAWPDNNASQHQLTQHIHIQRSIFGQIYLAEHSIPCGTSSVLYRARINSWIELELIINSIQFSMNWIGIELKDFELELNWNWKPELIGIDQFNQFIFNSTPHFTRLNIFLYAVLWKL